MKSKLISLKDFISKEIKFEQLPSITGGSGGTPTACTSNRTGSDNSRPDPQ